jgi:predicted ArsR family transcriptional regulator
MLHGVAVVALVTTTMFGLSRVGAHDVSVRHGQLVADAVALAAVEAGSDVAREVARRNGASVTSIATSSLAGERRLVVLVKFDGFTFRADAAGG